MGPDYIDPGYHALATGRPGRNLDAWLCGTSRIAPLFAHGAAGADVSVIEGVMGLFDGRLGPTDGVRGFGSTAHVATLLQAPVVLVMDAAGTSRTLAASALGLASHPNAPFVAGAIINRTGSPRAVAELRDAFAEVGIPVLGVVPRDKDLIVPSRHLGLVPAAEQALAREVVERTGALVAANVDLDAILAAARRAPDLTTTPWTPEVDDARSAPAARVAVAAGRAFTFRYAETTEILKAAGCEVVEFDPLTAPALPDDVAGLYLGGGFPEVFAEELAANRALLANVRAAVDAGLPTYAECAGLLYLCRRLDGADMAGAVPLDAAMSPRLTMGYRNLTALADSVAGRAGEQVRSHEFHRTITTPLPGSDVEPAWLVDTDPPRTEGIATPGLLASYQHVHWAGAPGIARAFTSAVSRFRDTPVAWQPSPRIAAEPRDGSPAGDPIVGKDSATDRDGVDPLALRHHGDAQLRPGLVDLAVNVRPAPDWLLAECAADPRGWAAYPDAGPARLALAAHHGLAPEQVLPTAGAADAFTLIARAFPGRNVAIVHPQFTEPEVAWRTAGHAVSRVLLSPNDGFRLDAAAVPDGTDLAVIGNPTNPTGVLHPAAEVRRLCRPGRIVVVDEAFMDFVPGEPESLLGGDLTGILVTRSLTKLWGIAGLRAGFIAGDPALVARLAEFQEPWPVSTPALVAMVTTAGDRAALEADAARAEVASQRHFLVAELGRAGFAVAGSPVTPFVLVDVSALSPAPVPERLAEAGFAVRRCDTFPGLGPGWIRLAVRDADTSRAVVAALDQLRTGS